jgi:NFU1 iron-sulfur cluster scaffold homolog, mitochondrial
VSDLVAEVTDALARSILPLVIARGAAGIRVIAAGDDGVITLEADGSPGAVLPVLGRIETQIRAAVPAVTAVRLAGAGPGPQSPEDGDLGRMAQRILDAQVNPSIAAHRGRVTVVSTGNGWVRVRLEGGCQGCSLAEVTIRQGIEPLLRARLPGVTGVADATDHEAGTDPFFSPEKR